MNGLCYILYVEAYHLHILYGFLDFLFGIKTWQWFETQITFGKYGIISMSSSGNYVLISKLLNCAIP